MAQNGWEGGNKNELILWDDRRIGQGRVYYIVDLDRIGDLWDVFVL